VQPLATAGWQGFSKPLGLHQLTIGRVRTAAYRSGEFPDAVVRTGGIDLMDLQVTRLWATPSGKSGVHSCVPRVTVPALSPRLIRMAVRISAAAVTRNLPHNSDMEALQQICRKANV
jgi:hypothetical protein